MTGDATRDHEASEHRFATPDVPWTENDYAAHEQDKAAALAEREREQRERMDAAHEKAKARKEAEREHTS